MSDRFERIYRQGFLSDGVMEIWRDNETGVCYVWHKDGSGGGLTVLVDRNGKPVVDQKHR